MATTFTTWAALRTAILDAIANHVAGDPCVGSYTVAGRTMEYRSIDELTKLLEMTYKLELLASPGSAATRVSYGRARRFGR